WKARRRMESSSTVNGLGLLAIRTSMRPDKMTRISCGHLLAPSLFGQPLSSTDVRGYEVHLGETEYLEGASPFARISADGWNGTFLDGCIADGGNAFGTYLHGIFDTDSFRHSFLIAARQFCHLAAPERLEDWRQRREQSLDRLATTVRSAVDLKTIFAFAGITCNEELQAKEDR
ncbi:cobyric acid synthase, partial [Terriglobus sp. YAF25]